MWGRSRIRSIIGGDFERNTVAAATTLGVPDDTNLIYLTGTATVTSLTASKSTRNRIVYFIQNDSGATTFTNTDGATVEGTMDLGGSNVTLGQDDVLCLILRSNGTWLAMFTKNN